MVLLDALPVLQDLPELGISFCVMNPLWLIFVCIWSHRAHLPHLTGHVQAARIVLFRRSWSRKSFSWFHQNINLQCTFSPHGIHVYTNHFILFIIRDHLNISAYKWLFNLK